LNAKIGGNADEFIDLKNEVIHSPTDYAAKYCEGFKRHLSDGTVNRAVRLFSEFQ
jgi:hypothetical protein